MSLHSSSREAEVLVVGASLAGLCAAYSAAHGGAETLLVDAAPKIGAHPNPATLLMEPLWRRTDLPLPERAVERELSGVRVGGPSGAGPLFRLCAFHVNRQVFDRGFAMLAADAGAIVRGGVRVIEALPSGGVLTEDGPVRACVTVFADGVNSAVREIMPTMRNPWDVTWGLTQLLESPGLGKPRYCQVRFGSFAPGWRAQLNPLGGSHASLCTFVRGVSRGELEGYAERARRSFLGSKEVRVLEERRGADPAFVMPYRISDDGVMACGAAAGQGGLEYGARADLVAGEVAAKAVRAGDASRRALRQYERTWRRETAAEALLMRWGMQALRHLTDAELDELFGGLSEVEVVEEDLLTLLRGDPRDALRSVGLGRSLSALLRLALGWVRAAGLSEGRRV